MPHLQVELAVEEKCEFLPFMQVRIGLLKKSMNIKYCEIGSRHAIVVLEGLRKLFQPATEQNYHRNQPTPTVTASTTCPVLRAGHRRERKRARQDQALGF